MLVITFNLYSQPGKDGNITVTTQNRILNEYTALNANASAGETSITVQSNLLNTNNRFSGSLSAGDLIFIIQVQGVIVSGTIINQPPDIFGFPKDSTWGEITDIGDCGNYEFKEVLSVSGNNIINLSCPLQNNYTTNGKTVIVRVPRINNLVVNSGASLTCDNWNGTTGGLLILETSGNITLNGSINANAKGFRGGLTDNQTTPGSGDVASNNSQYGANRGEGVAGFGTDLNYVGGRFGKGRAANAGGGGTAQNAGGGGGANAGSVLNWNGYGVPDISNASWIAAWNLQISGLALNNSSGGGKGGYTASTTNLNPLTNGPNNYNWSGDGRRDQGGFGGRPMDYSTGKLFMGGAGGAGDGDDGFSGRGGNAGGLIFIYCRGNIQGSGNIQSNGENGLNAAGNPSPTGIAGQDGAGGGGSGGTIVIEGTNSISSITLSANGGNGGLQTLSRGALNFNNNWNVQAQGPGGGGSGGYINVPVSGLNISVNGGNNGTTNSISMQNFTPNGATRGGVGLTQTNIPTMAPVIDTIFVCNGQSILIDLPDELANAEWYSVYNAITSFHSGNTFQTPAIGNDTTYYIKNCNFHFKIPVVIQVLNSNIQANAGADENICGNSLSLNATLPSGFTGSWTQISGTSQIINPTSPNSLVQNLSAGTNFYQWTITDGNCITAIDEVIINSLPVPPPSNAGLDQTICGTQVFLSGNNPSNFSVEWITLNSLINIQNTQNINTNATDLIEGENVFIFQILSGNSCPNSTDTVIINAIQFPEDANAGSDVEICGNNATLTANLPQGTSGTWSIIIGGGNIQSVNQPNTNVSNLSEGINLLVWTLSHPVCGTTTDTIQITVTATPAPADAGIDQNICGNTTQLNAISGLGVWSTTGTAIISNMNLMQADVSGLSPGENIFIWQVSIPGCPSSSDTCIINSSPLPSQAIAGTDQTVCGNIALLSGNIPEVGNSLWTSQNSNVSFSSTSTGVTTANFSEEGVYELIYTISTPSCGSNSDTLQIAVNPPLTLTSVNDFETCKDSVNLNLNHEFGTLNILSNSSAVNITQTSQINYLLVTSSIGDFSIFIENSFAGCETYRDTFLIKRIAGIQSNLSGNLISCNGETSLNLNVPASANVEWSALNQGTVFSTSNNPQTLVSYIDTGIIKIVSTINYADCPAKRDTFEISFKKNQVVSTFLNDTTIEAGENIILLLPPFLINTEWTFNPELSCLNCNNPEVSPAEDTYFYFTADDSNTCKYNDSVLVKVKRNFYAELPTAFSPNDDGNNDEFFIRSNGLEKLSFYIFDEYGNTLFSIDENESFDKKWDGTYKGKKLMPQVLVYSLIAEFKDKTQSVKKGKIYLHR